MISSVYNKDKYFHVIFFTHHSFEHTKQANIYTFNLPFYMSRWFLYGEQAFWFVQLSCKINGHVWFYTFHCCVNIVDPNLRFSPAQIYNDKLYFTQCIRYLIECHVNYVSLGKFIFGNSYICCHFLFEHVFRAIISGINQTAIWRIFISFNSLDEQICIHHEKVLTNSKQTYHS